MSRHPQLYQWIDTVVIRFPSLSKPQALGLALWSFGMVIARSCSLTAVADVLAPLMGQSYNTLRERLRDTYREADAKAGKQRVELDVTECWAPWLAWLLDSWSGQQIAIAMDATSLGDRFVVLAIRYCLSRLCRTSCLESFKGRGETRMEAGVAGIVETVSRPCTQRLDSHCVGGSWLIREVVV